MGAAPAGPYASPFSMRPSCSSRRPMRSPCSLTSALNARSSCITSSSFPASCGDVEGGQGSRAGALPSSPARQRPEAQRDSGGPGTRSRLGLPHTTADCWAHTYPGSGEAAAGGSCAGGGSRRGGPRASGARAHGGPAVGQHIAPADLQVPLLAGHVGLPQGYKDGVGIPPAHPLLRLQGRLGPCRVRVQIVLEEVRLAGVGRPGSAGSPLPGSSHLDPRRPPLHHSPGLQASPCQPIPR